MGPGFDPRLTPQTVMKNVRRLILFLSSIVGLWVLVSFGGAMLDSGNAAFWSNSLMWALLSTLIIMPALLVINHASNESSKARARQAHAQQRPTTPKADQKPFIQEESSEARTLWPEPEQDTEWPAHETTSEEERIHA